MSALGPQFDHTEAHAKTVEHLQGTDPDKYWRVSKPQSGAISHKIGDVGYAAFMPDHERVDIGGLIAHPGQRGLVRGALARADSHYPEHPQTLDAFDSGNLPGIYAHHGFAETSRLKFDDQYAPEHWNPERDGRPDVVFMSRPAAQGSLFPDTHPTTPPPMKNASSRAHSRRSELPGQLPLLGRKIISEGNP